LLSVIKVLFLVLFWYHFGIIVVLFWLYCCSSAISSILFLFCILFISGILQVVSEHFPRQKIMGKFFFKVETYSDVFKLQRSVVTHINPRSGIHTCRKYKWYLSAHLLATLVTPVGTPSSGSASDNTYIRIDLDFQKPSLDKPISRLTAIVSPRTALGKILSSTWVVG
jgi:hypothetical protein